MSTSPGATFERVYHELKRMLAEDELPPGSPIEPARIGEQIASSITPIRDALHRLTGERLGSGPIDVRGAI
ncbi:GntR family transcriptional regulator, partial [Serratia marcescens]|uniref:GntR family transcriptional regulator n=2 Tax=Enterobacterales TaxID=91347 RepID=UPI001952F37F